MEMKYETERSPIEEQVEIEIIVRTLCRLGLVSVSDVPTTALLVYKYNTVVSGKMIITLKRTGAVRQHIHYS